MKLLYIYKYAILGGVTTQLLNRFNYLKNHIEVHFLFIQDHGGTGAFNGYKNVVIEKDTAKIAQYIDYHKFDFVACIDTMEGYAALNKSKHKPIIISEVHTTTSNLYMLMDLKKTLPMDAFITPSHYLKDKIYNELGFKDFKECFVVENCLDTEIFNCDYNVRKHDKKIVAWVGKLDEHKNWRKLLEVAAKVCYSRGDVEFWIIGGYTAPQYVIKEFLDRINELNLFDNIKWYSYVDYNKMPMLYRKVAESGGLHLSTSMNESFGMTAAEAMACKCPLVMPKVGALPEVLDNKLSANLYEYKNNDKIVEKVNKQLDSNEQEKQNLIEYGYNKVLNQYTTQKIGKEYLEVLEEIYNIRNLL